MDAIGKTFTSLGQPSCCWKLSPAEIAALLQCDVLSFSSVTSREELPTEGGVYFLILDREIAYIGETWRLDLRWKRHTHRAELLKPNARIAFLVIDQGFPLIRSLVEMFFIRRFKPRLNKRSL